MVDGLAGIDLTGGLGIGLGAGLIAAIGRLGKLGSVAVNTYFKRNYTTKLEIPSSDLSYNWMLEHLARRKDFSAHFSIGTHAQRSSSGAIRKTDFNLKPSPGVHILWEKVPNFRVRLPIRVERTRSQPTASNTPFETIILETICKTKQDGKARMLAILEQARVEAMDELDTQSTIEIFGTNGQDWTTLSTQSRRSIRSVVLDPGENERILADMTTFVKNKNWYEKYY